jgi:hypothetical protein
MPGVVADEQPMVSGLGGQGDPASGGAAGGGQSTVPDQPAGRVPVSRSLVVSRDLGVSVVGTAAGTRPPWVIPN